MGILDTQLNFRSLSLKDLLEARDLYHWQLLNQENVVGTAVGLYLIRQDQAAHPSGAPASAPAGKARPAGPRTFDNSRVMENSWPCVLVLVRDWIEAGRFGGGGVDPRHFIPPTLYMPDGRRVPVCVVMVQPAPPVPPAPAAIRWPDSYIGGGFPIVAQVQGQEHAASVGCLVSDGHKIYALTNRHACGEPGTPIYARLRGQLVEVGRSSPLQLTRLPFSEVYPEFPGRRTFATLDIGLIDVDRADDWRSAVYGLAGGLGPVADLNELNIGLQLIEQPVEAFGAASGELHGRIKGLFYRHKAVAGFDYVSDFLIAPAGDRQTCQGDSGTVWHLRIGNDGGQAGELRPIAVEWGGQGLSGNGGRRYNFALASGLSNICRLLDVDLVRDHNDGATPFWGQTGHYSIATAAVGAVQEQKLRALLQANLDRISFEPNQLSAQQIKDKLAKGDFVELADVPDLVWKRTKDAAPGGRDYARNAGPEHPNHYADIDKPDAKGQTLRQLCLSDPSKIDPQFWSSFYQGVGETDAHHQGLLPLRVWQIFDAMVASLKAGDIARFICAAGVVSHYVGDACQPLHGSYLSDGYHDDPKAKKWPGMGVHSTYEDKMVDRFSTELLAQMAKLARSAAPAAHVPPPIADGHGAAFATIKLMDIAAGIIPPKELCDAYIALGGGTSKPVVQGLWDRFGPRTAQVMAAGARFLAAIWEAAYRASGATLKSAETFDEAALAKIYQDNAFVPSLTIDRIGAVLEGGAAAAAGKGAAAKKRSRKN